jgi:hypothetical protein
VKKVLPSEQSRDEVDWWLLLLNSPLLVRPALAALMPTHRAC